MAEYNFRTIEAKWQQFWAEKKIYQTEENTEKPKYYVLDMFPYPSGAGLHVGHPLGYIASDIIARYKRAKGFNVLHPMGFDSFGLPAEQYAIQTGQHPAITTTENITRYKEQLKNIGFSYDWDREVQTSDPNYYKWTQWIFMRLFEAWYNKTTDKAEHINTLIAEFEKNGNAKVKAVCDEDTPIFSAEIWKNFSEQERSDILLKYRLTYLADAYVNWCPALGTVLANDEVKDGVSERGGYPVERKLMRQWMMRITAYAERLLNDLETLDWSESIKEVQRNWIGKSVGAEVTFKLAQSEATITVFTTRIDTIYGVTYLVLAPENELVSEITTQTQKAEVEAYIEKASNRSERDRMADVKTVSGVFTGSYAINPFTNEQIPVWVAEYVLAGYGTGAVMGVPSSDDRDYRFATHFNLPIVRVIEGTEEAENPTEKKYGKMINSGFLNDLDTQEAIEKAIEFAEKNKFGLKKINYKMRDAVFSRQRYWGEPVPVYFKNGIPKLIEEKELPLELPKIDKYLPTETGEPPLGRAEDWKYQNEYEYELSTMPGWAGSSWYWLRYMDANNDKEFVSKEKEQYWQNVDLYIGGAEHGTGHLLYSRFWNKALFDLGYISKPEPFQKMINQGMIQGRSNFVYKVLYKEIHASKRLLEHLLPLGFIQETTSGDLKLDFIHKEKNIAVEIRSQSIIKENWQEYLAKYAEFMPQGCQVMFVSVEEIFVNVGEAIERIKKALSGGEILQFPENEYRLPNLFVSHNLKKDYETIDLHVDVNIVDNDILDIDAFRQWRPDLEDAEFILENDKYICGAEVEKMSKRWYNVVNPDNVVERYGADTLRLYEMFLGPLEQFKPWNTNGIEGTHKFLRKLWRLFHDASGEFQVSDVEASKEELKILHSTIKKVSEDIERFSFNTPVSSFMICVNELTDLKCNKKAILEPLLVLLAPYAPHITEELWSLLGHSESINTAQYPTSEEKYLQEDSFAYPISINGKLRTTIDFALDTPKDIMEKAVLENEIVQKWLEGKPAKKIIIVPKKIVNVVI
ncbi:MAG: class I tRNA ligase family protein [Thermonemataceae bacterium]|nr:class I tRNA ligase family protein [Thermonemataceae bacterium]